MLTEKKEEPNQTAIGYLEKGINEPKQTKSNQTAQQDNCKKE